MNPSPFSRAVVAIRIDDKGNLIHGQMEVPIDDDPTLARLLSFFPGVGTGKSSRTAGGWIPGVLVDLHRPDGSQLRILIDPSMRYWTEQRGDWALDPRFHEFVASLRSPTSPPRRRRTEHLPRAAHCRACGHDLRAITTECPECGAPIPTET